MRKKRSLKYKLRPLHIDMRQYESKYYRGISWGPAEQKSYNNVLMK